MFNNGLKDQSAVGGLSLEEIESHVNSHRLVLGKRCADVFSLLVQSDDEHIKRVANKLRNECYVHSVAVTHDRESGKYSLRTEDQTHCDLAFCPVCGFNKKVAKSNDFRRACETIKKEKPTYKFLFLTISPRNFLLSDLKKVFPYIQKIWSAFKKQYFSGENMGWIRVVHIKPPETDAQIYDGDAVNFHLHILFLVPRNFECNEEVIAEWQTFWMCRGEWDRLNFHVERIQNGSKKYEEALLRVRYMIRPIELIGADVRWAEKCIHQAFGQNIFSTGGILRKELRNALKDYKRERRSAEKSRKNRFESSSVVTLRWDREQDKYCATGIYPF